LEQFSLCVAFEAKVLGISGVSALVLVDVSGDCITSIDPNDFLSIEQFFLAS
jgi:hypothetical protein